MALLASGTYLEDKNMAVMNPMGGGIDTDVQNRMMQLRNDPNALGQQAQKSGDILDLIAARRAADLVAEQKKMLALQMNGSPATVKDQVEKELVDGQKAEMRGPLQSLQGKTQGVAGVLQNQQQQQGRGQPQGQPMRAAMGGIINAPAPNLNRMYNGGIVGYKKGGEISKEEYIEKVKALIASGVAQEDAMSQMDKEFDILSGSREGRTGFFDMPSEKDELSLEDNRLLPKGNRRFISGDDAYGLSRTGTKDTLTNAMGSYLKFAGVKPDEAEAEPTASAVAPTVASAITPTVTEPEIDPVAAAEAEYAKYKSTLPPEPNVFRAKPGDPLASIPDEAAAASDAREAARQAAKQAEIETVKPEEPKISQAAFGEMVQGMPGREGFNQKVAVDKEQAQEDAFQAAQTAKSQSPVGLLKAQLAEMDGKKGIAGLVERFANTNFQKSYGGTGEALAQAGRDIAKTGSDEKAAKRKFLEDQLGVQQSIEAAQVKATAKESEFGRGLAETQAARKQAGNEFDQKFKQLGTQFDETFKQNGAYQDAKLKVEDRTNEIRAITEGNNTALLSSKNQREVFAILQTMRNDYDKMIELEVGNIIDRPGEDSVAKRAAAEAHRKTRNTEFANLQASLVGTLRGGSGGGSGGSGWGDPSVKGT